MNETYKKYLGSSDWKAKRATKHDRKGGRKKRCAICAATSDLDVHHLRYESDLSTVEQHDLRILCRRCHDLAHELIRAGVIKFTNSSHHSRFAFTKNAVKKALGLTGVNCFREDVTDVD